MEGLNADKIIVLRGLDNMGNTCYMNSTLQVLYATHEFREYLFRWKSSEEIEAPLHHSAAQLFRMMNDTNNTESDLRPLDFWSTFTHIKKDFREKRQYDAQECLTYILDTLHEEVNKAKKNKTEGDKKEINSEHKVSDARSAWKCFIKNMADSFLVKLFVGQFKSTIKCLKCSNESHCWDIFYEVSVPLPSEDKDCDVNDCLKLFFAEETMDSDSMPFCSNCNEKQKSVKSLTFEKIPLILIIHLKKFNMHGEKISKMININEEIDLADRKYELYACICHWGSGCSRGHYDSYCKHGDQWFSFDDNSVHTMKKFDITDIVEAYILFYRFKGMTIKI